jgi:hypothetical protein
MQLFEIFQLGCGLLKKAYEMVKTIDFNDVDQVSEELFVIPVTQTSSAGFFI